MPIPDEGFYDPGALSHGSWWSQNMPSWLGGAPSGYGDPGTVDASGSGAASDDLAKALQGAQKLAGTPPSAAPQSSANVGGAAQIGQPRSAGQLNQLLQLLMQRNAALMPQGAAQAARTNQPGLLGI